MAQYIKTTFSRVINGKKYKMYPKTITEQVIDADGVDLSTILANLVESSEVDAIKDSLKTFKNLYRLRGILVDSADQTAMQKLYEKSGSEIGDIYLVQIAGDSKNRTFEQYVYTGSTYGWQFFGLGTANVANKLPEELGEPGTYLLVSEDGTSLEFSSTDVRAEGKSLIKSHNNDSEAHPDIRKDIEKLTNVTYSDVLKQSNWVLNRDTKKYQYKYTSDNLEVNSYFTITPIIEDDNSLGEIIANAEISPSFAITSTDDEISAVLTASYLPKSDIPIFVKIIPKITNISDEDE